MDGVVENGVSLDVKVGDGFLSLNNTLKIRNSYLYALDGQWTTYGPMEKYLYLALNRVPYGNLRSGSGLCSVKIKLERSKGRNIQPILTLLAILHCKYQGIISNKQPNPNPNPNPNPKPNPKPKP